MSSTHNRDRITKMRDLAELVAGEYQAALSARTDRLAHHTVGPLGINPLLALSRDIDTLERIMADLSQMLDSRPLRPVSLPPGSTPHE